MLRFYEFSLKYSSVIGGRGENCSLEVAYYRPSVKNGDVQGYALFHCWDKIDKMNFAWSRKFYPDNFKAANVFHTLLVIVKIGKPGQKDTYVIMKKFISSLFVFEIFSWSTLIIIICLERCNSLMSSKKLVRWLLCCFENTEKATFGFVVIKIRNLFMIAWVPSM